MSRTGTSLLQMHCRDLRRFCVAWLLKALSRDADEARISDDDDARSVCRFTGTVPRAARRNSSARSPGDGGCDVHPRSRRCAFEQNFAAYVGADHCVGVESGTAAIQFALEALGIGAGDEVIVPANTYIASALAVSAIGALPVLVDVDSNYLDRLRFARGRADAAYEGDHAGSPLRSGRADGTDPGFRAAPRALRDRGRGPSAWRALERPARGSFGDVGCFQFLSRKESRGVRRRRCDRYFRRGTRRPAASLARFRAAQEIRASRQGRELPPRFDSSRGARRQAPPSRRVERRAAATRRRLRRAAFKDRHQAAGRRGRGPRLPSLRHRGRTSRSRRGAAARTRHRDREFITRYRFICSRHTRNSDSGAVRFREPNGAPNAFSRFRCFPS